MSSSWRLAASQKGRVNSGLRGLGRGLVYSVAMTLLLCLLCSLRAKYERAHHARGTSSAVDEAQGVFGDLAFSSPAHNLAGCLNYVSETTSPTYRLAGGDLTTVGIDGKAPFVGRIDRIEEGADFSLLAESSIFEAHGREDGVSIVDFGEVDILGSVPRHLKGFAG